MFVVYVYFLCFVLYLHCICGDKKLQDFKHATRPAAASQSGCGFIGSGRSGKSSSVGSRIEMDRSFRSRMRSVMSAANRPTGWIALATSCQRLFAAYEINWSSERVRNSIEKIDFSSLL